MNDLASPDHYGALTEPATLTIQRLLPGPVERVWAYLIEPDLRRKWLADGAMATDIGAPFTLTWRNDELTTPPGTRPPGFDAEHSMQSRVTELDPPRRLAFTWGQSGGVTFEPSAFWKLMGMRKRPPTYRFWLPSILAVYTSKPSGVSLEYVEALACGVVSTSAMRVHSMAPSFEKRTITMR